MAEVIGLGLGTLGGMLLGGQLFKLLQPDDFSYLEDDLADDSLRIHETSTVESPAKVRAMLPFLPNWISEPDYEQVRWLNSTVALLWPTLRKAVYKKVMEEVGPILEDVVHKTPLLDALTLEELDLGEQPLTLGGVKVYNSLEDAVILEAQILWGSSAKVHASALVRLGPAAVYVPVKLEDVSVKGQVRITVRPLVETLPCVGGVSVCLVSPPYVDAAVKAVNDWDLLSVPGLHEAVCAVLRKVCIATCVYPKELSIPVMPNFGLPKPFAGMLELHIDRIENLRGSENIFGMGNPFIRMSMVHYDADGNILRQAPFHHTNAIKSAASPVFNETHRILVEDTGPDWALLIEVLDYDWIAPPDLMAQYRLPLDDSPNAAFSFLRRPQRECKIVASLETPERQGADGEVQVKNLENIMSFDWASLQLEANASFGLLFMSVRFAPFVRPEDDTDVTSPDEAVAKAQWHSRSRKVSPSVKGVLTVHLTRCSDLPLVGGRCNPFVELRVSDPQRAEPEVKVTEVMTDDTSPRFWKVFQFVFISATSNLTVSVFHKTGVFDLQNLVHLQHKDEFLGKVRIPVRDVVKAARVQDQFPLQEAHHGEVHMTLDWQPVELEDVQL